MKIKLFAIAAVALLVASCGSKSKVDNTFTINATLPAEANGATAFLVNFDTGEKLDSVTVENGAATFAGSVETPAVVRLIVDGSRMGVFMLEPGVITYADREAKGTPLNDLNNEVSARINTFGERFQAAPDDSTGVAVRQAIEAEYNAYIDSVCSANLDASGCHYPAFKLRVMATASLVNRINQMLTLVETLEFGDTLFETVKPLAFGSVLMLFTVVYLIPYLH